MKAIINCAISIKEIVLVVHDTLVKLNVMWKLDGMNITSAEKKTNHEVTMDDEGMVVLTQKGENENLTKNIFRVTGG